MTSDHYWRFQSDGGCPCGQMKRLRPQKTPPFTGDSTSVWWPIVPSAAGTETRTKGGVQSMAIEKPTRGSGDEGDFRPRRRKTFRLIPGWEGGIKADHLPFRPGESPVSSPTTPCIEGTGCRLPQLITPRNPSRTPPPLPGALTSLGPRLMPNLAAGRQTS